MKKVVLLCFFLSLVLFVSCRNIPKLIHPPALPKDKIRQHPTKSGYARWIFSSTERIVSTPALGPDGTIYISSLDRSLFAVSPQGKKKWSYATDDLVLSSPATAIDGTVYIASKDSYLYAVGGDGKELWKFGTQGIIDSSPRVAADGTIYIASHDANLYAVNPQGKQIWTYQAADKFKRSTPALAADGTIYIGSQDGFLHAVSPKGTRKWLLKACDSITASPTVDTDGTVYIGCWDGRLQAILPNRSIKWTFRTKGPILATPVLGRDGTVYIGSDDKFFYAINPQTGTERWKFQSGVYQKKMKKFIRKPVNGSQGYIQASAALDGSGRLYFGSVNEYLYALTSKGKLFWQFDAGGWVDNAPIVGRYNQRDVIYVAAGRRLYAMNP